MTDGSPDADRADALTAAVADALAASEPLCLQGAGTKTFIGEAGAGRPLPVAGHRGVVTYEPSELVLTARAGTPLAEIEARLAEAGQMLPFEPPHFGDGATLGGAIACGLSGPRRPYAGAARDYVLGVRLVNGRAEVGRYGGEVMKNVAGYDVSRLMVGALGTLGLILEVSLKVLPRPEQEATRVLDLDAAAAIRLFSELGGRPVPMSAAAWHRSSTSLHNCAVSKGTRAAALYPSRITFDRNAICPGVSLGMRMPAMTSLNASVSSSTARINWSLIR
jgi:glycolate oxidase FAD binding subunit